MGDLQTKEMGLDHTEFFRLLPKALEGLSWSARDDGALVSIGNGKVAITLSAVGQRRIASISLPVTTVTFAFDGLDEPARQTFLKKFDQAYQRGGG